MSYLRKINMKAIAISVAALFCISIAYSQEAAKSSREKEVMTDQSPKSYDRHRIIVYYGMGYANNIYDKADKSFMYSNYSLSSSVELKYAYFFAPEWGVSLGAGVSCFAAEGVLNVEGVIPHYNDPAFDPSGKRYYDLHYKTDNLVEQQRVWALEVPLQFHFEHLFNGKNGIFASIGPKGYFPLISAQSTFPQGKGTLTTSGYEAYTNTWYSDPPHFGIQDARSTPATVKLRYSVDALGEFGGIFRLSNGCDLYTGIYGGYSFMDVLPKAADKKDIITPGHNDVFVVNSLLASDVLGEYNAYIKNNHLDWKTADEKWNRWQVGIKIGIHFKIK